MDFCIFMVIRIEGEYMIKITTLMEESINQCKESNRYTYSLHGLHFLPYKHSTDRFVKVLKPQNLYNLTRINTSPFSILNLFDFKESKISN